MKVERLTADPKTRDSLRHTRNSWAVGVLLPCWARRRELRGRAAALPMFEAAIRRWFAIYPHLRGKRKR